jgi:hypothetical protein
MGVLKGDPQAERPGHGGSQVGQVLLGFPTLQPLIEDIDQTVVMTDPEDELAVDPSYLAEDLLVIQAGIAHKAQGVCGNRARVVRMAR